MKHRGNGHRGGFRPNVTLIDKNKPSSSDADVLEDAQAPGRWVMCETRTATKTKGGLELPVPVVQGLGNVVRSVGPKVADVLGFSLKEGDYIGFVGGNEMNFGGRRFTLVDAASIFIRLDPEIAEAYFDGEDAPLVIASINPEAS